MCNKTKIILVNGNELFCVILEIDESIILIFKLLQFLIMS